MSRWSKKLFAFAIKRSIIVLSSRDYLLHHPSPSPAPPPRKARAIGKNDEKPSEKPEKKEKKVKVSCLCQRSEIQWADECLFLGDVRVAR